MRKRYLLPTVPSLGTVQNAEDNSDTEEEQERIDTDEEPRMWTKDYPIGEEDGEQREKIVAMLSEFKESWNGRRGKMGATKTVSNSKPGPVPSTKLHIELVQLHGKRRRPK